jgi:hypothetical protein
VIGLASLLIASPALADTFWVTRTTGGNSATGSLPWAITQANGRPGFDYVKFNLPGSGVRTITVSDTLWIADPVHVVGKSQAGYANSPLVYVVGTNQVASLFALTTGSSGSSLDGLGMYSYWSNAVTIFPSSNGNWIVDNWIGFMPTQNGVQRNSSLHQLTRGIGIQSNGNTIWGNTISGVENGITVGEDIAGAWSGQTYRHNQFLYNNIGTDPTGNTASGYGNKGDGIFFGAGAQENYIGPANVLSGNDSTGVELLHSSNTGNVIFANVIGTNRAGKSAVANGELGVMIANGASGNAVGGPWGGNVISANNLAGVALGHDTWQGATGNWVHGNTIGLDINQSKKVGPQDVGITLADGAVGNDVQNNVVAGAITHGIILGRASYNNVSSNWIGRNPQGKNIANGAYGIVLIDSSWNSLHWNQFGTNRYGSIGSFGSSGNNDVQ